MGESSFVVDAAPSPVSSMGKVGNQKSGFPNFGYYFIFDPIDVILPVEY